MRGSVIITLRNIELQENDDGKMKGYVIITLINSINLYGRKVTRKCGFEQDNVQCVNSKPPCTLLIFPNEDRTAEWCSYQVQVDFISLLPAQRRGSIVIRQLECDVLSCNSIHVQNNFYPPIITARCRKCHILSNHITRTKGQDLTCQSINENTQLYKKCGFFNFFQKLKAPKIASENFLSSGAA